MNEFTYPLPLRWADMDPNGHVRHSVYYDAGATARTHFLFAAGITFEYMREHHFGPVLFREEAVFRRELRFGDELSINILISKLRKDASRFCFRHDIVRADGTLCARMLADGAWIDTDLRKLGPPPPLVTEIFLNGPRSEDFEWI